MISGTSEFEPEFRDSEFSPYILLVSVFEGPYVVNKLF